MERVELKINKADRLGPGGFTLAEVMAVIAILGILSAIAIPNYIKYRRKGQLAEIAANLSAFEKGFIAFALEHGGFPDDCHTDNGPFGLPDELDGVSNTQIVKYIRTDAWVKPTPLGGRYNWEGPDTYWDAFGYVGISIDEGTAPQETFRLLDGLIDDGDLSSGKFRLTPNTRYTYMIRQQ